MAITRIQGAYYVLTGLWSLAHLRSFETMTGPKRDRWLVRTIGLLTVGIGGGLARHGGTRAGRDFADASAVAFAIGDLLAVRAGQSRIYLADAVAECALIAARHVIGATKRTSPVSAGAHRRLSQASGS